MTQDLLTRRLLDKLLSDGARATARVNTPLTGDIAHSLNAANDGEVIKFEGYATQDEQRPQMRSYTPDQTKGFVSFAMAHAFPVTTVFGQALHPNVVSQSFKSLLFQGVNLEHVLVSYGQSQDKLLGSVVAVAYPNTPTGGWRVGTDPKNTPGITAVAAFSKNARGMDGVVGKHKSNRHKFAVSMEVSYGLSTSAFAVALNKGKPKFDTPSDMLDAGFELIPWTSAPEGLLACFSMKKQQITSDYKGRRVIHLMGGISEPVHFAGVAICHYGAEPTAKIMQMAASATDSVVEKTLAPLRKLVDLAKKG